MRGSGSTFSRKLTICIYMYVDTFTAFLADCFGLVYMLYVLVHIYYCCSKEEVDTHKKKRKKESLASEGDPTEVGRKAKRKRRTLAGDEEEEREGGASWEGVRKGGGGEEEGEVHYLLPLKTRRGLVLQPPVPKSDGTCICTL